MVSTFGLYSAFLACRAMNFRSRGQPRFTVETMFLHGNSQSPEGYAEVSVSVSV